MLNNVDLVEEYERVENGESGIVENAREDHIFQILKPVCVVNLSLNVVVLDSYDLFEFRFVGKILSVVRLV